MALAPKLIGKTFGKLTVIGRAENKRYPGRGGSHSRWICHCSCGKEKTVWGTCLVRGTTKSCGCNRLIYAHKHHLWKGGKSTNDGGYVQFSSGESAGKLEHRIIMEGIIGRQLLPGETVHHKNGIRDDNRPENLELKASNHSSGQSIPDLVEWATEILNRYAPEKLKENLWPYKIRTS